MSAEQRIRERLRRSGDAASVELPPVTRIMAPRRRPAAPVGVVLVAVVVALAVTVVGAALRRPATVDDPSVDDAPVADGPQVIRAAPPLDVGDLDRAAWQPVPPGPVDAAGASVLWTGDDVLVWDGATADGAVYRPSSDGWREMAEPPSGGTGELGRAVWTGAEMIVWGGSDASTRGMAYDPRDDAWRLMREAPVPATESPVVVWTGTEVLVWGGTTDGGFIPDEPEGAAYDPQTDTWRLLPSPGLRGRSAATGVWTGHELVVWGGQRADNSPLLDGAAYDPRADRWRSLAPSPAAGYFEHSAVWTGDEMLVWGWVQGSTGQRNETVAYDPIADRWRQLEPAPLRPPPPNEGLGGQSAVWAGRAMLAWSGTLDERGPLALAYVPARDQWRRLPLAPTPMWQSPGLAWTDAGLFVWRGYGGDTSRATGAVLRFGP